MKTLITTVPFASKNRLPLEMLNLVGIDPVINPLNRKLKENELCEMIKDFEVLIAGTEPITERVIKNAKNLKLISRVGIGLDNVNLIKAKESNVQVTYTPDAPAPAVAELTIGLMLSLLRHISFSNQNLKSGIWERTFGKRIPEITIGIIGSGRIGGRVIRRLVSFGSPRLLVNDLYPNEKISPKSKIEWVDKKTIYKEADLITIHVPLTNKTRNMITKKELNLMKKDALLINTARGGIINEDDLILALKEKKLGGAALDVFNNEPYNGPLLNIKNCILTPHLGSMSEDCRVRMEIEATEDVVNFVKGKTLFRPVPSEEIENQISSLKYV